MIKFLIVYLALSVLFNVRFYIKIGSKTGWDTLEWVISFTLAPIIMVLWLKNTIIKFLKEKKHD